MSRSRRHWHAGHGHVCPSGIRVVAAATVHHGDRTGQPDPQYTIGKLQNTLYKQFSTTVIHKKFSTKVFHARRMGNSTSNGRNDCYCRRCGSRSSVNSKGKCEGCVGYSSGSSRYCRRCGSYSDDIQSNGKCEGCKGHST
jgi:hypothetical protein